MIAETIPQIQKLTVEEKYLLANELWESVEENESRIPFNAAVAELIDQRMQDYRENPESAMTWEEFKASIGKD